MSNLNFCNDCDNCMILKVNSAEAKQTLEYHCNNCGNVDKNITKRCLVKNDYNLQELYILDKNVKYISDDPSNPRVNNIPCPNNDCESNKTKQYDVVYISINDDDMKFLYLCNYCKKTWTNN